ncbi:MAG: hypothetical protein WBX11_12020 [Thiobacillaceae bacterium]
MREHEAQASSAAGSRWLRLLVIWLLVGVTSVLIWKQLPRGGYSSDLSLIGKGRSVLVLGYDKNYASGTGVMGFMNALRGDYASRVVFLVTVLGARDGNDFTRRYALSDGTVLLFLGDGTLAKRLDQPRSVDELRNALREAFSL